MDLSQDKAPQLLNNIRYGCKTSDDTDAFEKDTEPGVSKLAIDIDRKSARTEQETIKDNIRRMDDVCWEDEDRSIFVDVLETECGIIVEKTIIFLFLSQRYIKLVEFHTGGRSSGDSERSAENEFEQLPETGARRDQRR